MIVVDASVLTDVLLDRAPAPEAVAQELSANGRESGWMHAPELIEPETLNALRRLVLAGRLSEERAAEALVDMGDLRLRRHLHAPLRARVWELRHNLTAYDATYLSLAEALDEGRLLTADASLARQAAQLLGAGRVRHVG